MTFLSLILVLAFVQWWGSGAPVQKDGWFVAYRCWLAERFAQDQESLRLLLVVLGPVLGLWLLTGLVATWLSSFWLLVIAVLVLLYSLGRGDFTAQVRTYIEACEREDSVAAAQALSQWQGHERQEPDPDDWPSLHRQALRAIAYRGFERMFAVIFWFFVLGPIGALLYRLSVLYRSQEPTAVAERWVWLLEWPVVRLMGLTWAMAGNFDTCFLRCQRGVLDINRSSTELLDEQLNGALGAQEQGLTSLDAVRASQPLFSRSLLIWVSVLALVTLLA